MLYNYVFCEAEKGLVFEVEVEGGYTDRDIDSIVREIGGVNSFWEFEAPLRTDSRLHIPINIKRMDDDPDIL
jgi:hypothetical protein